MPLIPAFSLNDNHDNNNHTMNPLLAVNNLSVAFHQKNNDDTIVKNISFTIGQCETVALVGESGSGKSLTAHSIMRLLPYPVAFHPSGSILFEDRNLLELSPKAMTAIRGNQIGMIFQEPMSALNPLHTVEKQIAEVLKIHQDNKKSSLRDQVLQLLTQVQIPEPESRLSAYPHQLSGGQRQRVMIAMALANRPKLLIADEPTTALDVTVQKDILDLLKNLQKEYQMSILLITHDLGVVNYIAERVLVMHNGEIVEEGNTKEVLRHPAHAYTQQLLNSRPEGTAVSLNKALSELPSIMYTEALNVRFPKNNPLFGRCKDFAHILKDITIQLREGSTLGIVGESGSGKSTLAFAMLRLLKSEGHISFDGKAIDGLNEKAIRPLRSEIQVVFQDPFASLSPRMSVKQIISEGLLIHQSLDAQSVDDKVIAIMQEVGLDPETKERYPHEFSGGQRQRIAIARALILNPRVVFLDEPTSALDRAVQMKIITLLKELQQKRQLSYVFISHDIHVINAISHQVIVMKEGEIVEQGLTSTVLHKPSHPYTKKLLSATLSTN